MHSQNMTEQPESSNGTPSEPEELRQEIQETREELGETVEVLAQKIDVKAQTRDKVTEGKEVIRDKGEQLKGKVLELGQKAQSAMPDRAQQVIGQAIEETKQRPLPVCTAFFLGFLLGLICRKRQ